MARYLLLLHGDETAEDELTADEARTIVERHLTLVRELAAAGALVASEALQHSSRTKVVRPNGRGGGTVTDGPFAETKEVVGGFYLLECEDEAEALAWAKRMPVGPGLAVEVRPVAEV
jgi:hypothetical protein